MLETIRRVRKNSKRVLGLNERSLEFIRPNNPRSRINIADDKLATKQLLMDNGLPVPELIHTIDNREDLEAFDFASLPCSFVIKPVHGMRGGGIHIFYNRDKEGNFITSNGKRYSEKTLRSIANDILDGRYSLFNEPDIVMIEKRVRPLKAFRYYSYKKGTPDVRVIAYNDIPVMGMLRLPTAISEGKANLDRGAVGAGIDMAVGKTTSAIYGKSGQIEKIPGTNLSVSGLQIPYWNKILRYSSEVSQIAGLGFLSIDFLIDKDQGPVITEINARSGLSIQLANMQGLRARLKKVADLKPKSVKHAVRLSKDMFGGEIEESIEAISGMHVIGLIENATLYSKDGEKTITIKAKIDTGADRTSIDTQLLRELGYESAIDYFDSFNYPKFSNPDEAKAVGKKRDELIESGKIEEHPDIKSRSIVRSSSGATIRPVLGFTFALNGSPAKETKVTAIDRSRLTYKMIVGKKDLKEFLIDPNRKYFTPQQK